MSAAALLAVAVLHAIASVDQILRGEIPIGIMLAGFTIADAGLLWMAYSRA